MGLKPYEDDTASKIDGNAGNVICHVKARNKTGIAVNGTYGYSSAGNFEKPGN